jgi:hypothetical protein
VEEILPLIAVEYAVGIIVHVLIVEVLLMATIWKIIVVSVIMIHHKLKVFL